MNGSSERICRAGRATRGWLAWQLRYVVRSRCVAAERRATHHAMARWLARWREEACYAAATAGLADIGWRRANARRAQEAVVRWHEVARWWRTARRAQSGAIGRRRHEALRRGMTRLDDWRAVLVERAVTWAVADARAQAHRRAALATAVGRMQAVAADARRLRGAARAMGRRMALQRTLATWAAQLEEAAVRATRLRVGRRSSSRWWLAHAFGLLLERTSRRRD